MEQEVKYKITGKLTQDCIDTILKVEESKGLTAENLLETAKNPKSPLHEFFDWDDSEAANKWRLAQARILINEVKVIIENKEYYAFENVQIATTDNSGGKESTESIRVYKPVIEIMSQEELRKQVISAALRQLSYWEEQNSKYNELKPIIKTASKVRKDLDKKWQKKQ